MAIRLPVLRTEPDRVDRVEIATPCEVSWDSMYGDERVRHCGSCRQNVYNVAQLTRAQALELIAAAERSKGSHRVCLRIYRRPDGTVVTADCWSRLRAARRRGVWAFVAMLVIIGWAQLAAMFVGVSGLRRLVGTPRMGSTSMGQRRLTVEPAPTPPARPAPPASSDEIIMGDLMPKIRTTMGEAAPPLDLVPPKHHKPSTNKTGTIVTKPRTVTAVVGRMTVR